MTKFVNSFGLVFLFGILLLVICIYREEEFVLVLVPKFAIINLYNTRYVLSNKLFYSVSYISDPDIGWENPAVVAWR